jgi:hypothetical protein
LTDDFKMTTISYCGWVQVFFEKYDIDMKRRKRLAEKNDLEQLLLLNKEIENGGS